MTTRFGISTHLFHGERLRRDHLAQVAGHGFTAVEIYATRTHFDYHDPAAAVALGESLAATGLTLHAVHAPTTTSFTAGRSGDALSLASADEPRRQQAVAETVMALGVASVVPFSYLVVHIGVPASEPAANSRAAAARSLETVAEAAAGVGVSLALELIPNPLSTAARLVQLLEDDLEIATAGICLDVGHAHIGGDVMDAIETASGHILTTHLHDNGGRRDDHLVPGQGRIDWDGVTMAFQKVGYDGAWIFELAPATEPGPVLAQAADARDRLLRLMQFDA